MEDDKDWRFTQWFRKMPTENSGPEDDDLSAIAFDETGKYVATGDHSGRIVVLENEQEKKDEKLHYKFHCEFQSHSTEIDYVRSVNIEARIQDIKFCAPSCGAQFMLTTNDRCIKLFKVQEKEIKYSTGFNLSKPSAGGKQKQIRHLRFPLVEPVDACPQATMRRLYPRDIHKFNIHSLSVNIDGSTFMSADNLVINLWDINRTDEIYNIVDIKPVNMQTLTEVITTASLDPCNSHAMIYATNKGEIRLSDLRVKALCDKPTRSFSPPRPPSVKIRSSINNSKSAIQEILMSISDAKFSNGGRQIIGRDYLTVKIWDLAMDKEPVRVIPVQEFLHQKLPTLYETDCIFDSFDLAVSPTGEIATGSYGNYFHIFDIKENSDILMEASKASVARGPIGTSTSKSANQKNSDKKRSSVSAPFMNLFWSSSRKNNRMSESSIGSDGGVTSAIDADNINLKQKVLKAVWHPEQDAIAVAEGNNMFIYAK